MFVSAAASIYCIQFHWQFLITNYVFWLINILLRKFDALSKKYMKMIKTQFLMKSKQKKTKKVLRT